MTRMRLALTVLVAIAVLPAAPLTSSAEPAPTALAGLRGLVKVVRDASGVPHVYARSEHDAYFIVGYLHAQDRLFQMDQSRRQASGTLAELLGSGALSTDVVLRLIGLRRAAVRSLAALSPQTRALLEAYAAGVNAWLSANPLPPEYTALELTKASVPPWTALDCVAVTKLLTFGLSFDSSDIRNSQLLIAYQTAGAALGFDGARLFTEDVMRSEPFAHAPSILPGETSQNLQTHGRPPWSSSALGPEVAAATEQALERLEKAGVPTNRPEQGSNVWVVSGEKSESGRPMVASDPHLSLISPPVFYEVGVDVSGTPGEALSLYGVTFPGTPFVVHGTNGRVSWGSTVNPTDVTDFYLEQLMLAGGIPVATRHLGNTEPTQIIPETFRANRPGNGTPDDLVVVPPSPAAGIPAATVIVPRRNNGPLISISGSTGLSVQYTGLSPTREPDFFRLLSRAKTVGEAIDAQRYFDVGAQNWMYVDDRGNVGYKTSGEIPLREDLQAETVAGLPPYFIRSGTGGNEWVADPTPAEDQALAYEILPFAEMDGLVNPARGWISNANQDPTGQTFDNDPLNELRPGGGIRYITPGHADGNRNARVTARLQEVLADGAVSFAEMESIQSDVKLNDAAVLVPYIVRALQAAQTPGAPAPLAALGAEARVQEAVARLDAWDFSTPTGLPEGYDASDTDGGLSPPTQAEIDASVAATIYSLWRGQALRLIVDVPLTARGLGAFLPSGDQAMTALRRLLAGNGTGASGIVFFAGPVGRDTAILQALRTALDLAAGDAFAPAFGRSTRLADYHWGKLHRIVLRHLLGGPFSIPPGAGFGDVGPGLAGIATDGGFSVVDASSHPRAVQVIPGGEGGNSLNAFFGNQLGRWLTNDYHAATTRAGDVEREATGRQIFVPAP